METFSSGAALSPLGRIRGLESRETMSTDMSNVILDA